MSNYKPYLGERERKYYIRIAKELGYKQDVFDAIKNASTESEISGIMCRARKRNR